MQLNKVIFTKVDRLMIVALFIAIIVGLITTFYSLHLALAILFSSIGFVVLYGISLLVLLITLSFF